MQCRLGSAGGKMFSYDPNFSFSKSAANKIKLQKIFYHVPRQLAIFIVN